MSETLDTAMNPATTDAGYLACLYRSCRRHRSARRNRLTHKSAVHSVLSICDAADIAAQRLSVPIHLTRPVQHTTIDLTTPPVQHTTFHVHSFQSKLLHHDISLILRLHLCNTRQFCVNLFQLRVHRQALILQLHLCRTRRLHVYLLQS